jgi:hypothetical protein
VPAGLFASKDGLMADFIQPWNTYADIVID